jgi:hypothetical protein
MVRLQTLGELRVEAAGPAPRPAEALAHYRRAAALRKDGDQDLRPLSWDRDARAARLEPQR